MIRKSARVQVNIQDRNAFAQGVYEGMQGLSGTVRTVLDPTFLNKTGAAEIVFDAPVTIGNTRRDTCWFLFEDLLPIEDACDNTEA